METICAVIVTFNRLKLLKEAIHGILTQTIKIDRIVIVDNDSKDGTREWLRTIESDIITIIFQENTGGAGGFNTGVKYAFENGYDWIWMMDDDVVPESNCLEELLKYKSISECLHPRKIYSDGVDRYWEHYYNYTTGLIFGSKNQSFRNEKNICFLNVGNFEGMLISKNVVSKIGFPNIKYFIAGDDTEYGFLASFFTNVSYLKNAVIKRNKKSDEDGESIFYLYYFIRNRHLLKELIDYVDGDKSVKNFDRTTFKMVRYNIYKTLFGKYTISEKIKRIFIIIRAFRDCKNKVIGNSY